MRTLKDLEKQLKKLEYQAGKNDLDVFLDNGRNIKIRCGSSDGLINLMKGVLQDNNHPCREIFKHAIRGHPEQGAIVMICKALIESNGHSSCRTIK